METGRSQPNIGREPQVGKAETGGVAGVQRPDLNNLGPWLKQNVTTPFGGFEDLKGRNGKPLNHRQQLEASRGQLASMVKSNLEAGINPKAIEDMLVEIVTPDSPEEQK